MVHTILLESQASYFLSAECDFSWSNETTVLVTTNRFHTLETADCHAVIFWIGQCWSEVGLTDYRANCTTTCDNQNLRQADEVAPKDGDSASLIKAVIGVLVLLGLFGLIFLLYKFKERILRFYRLLYRRVPKGNDPEQPYASKEGE